MKKLITLLTILALMLTAVFALSACNNDTPVTDNGGGNDEGDDNQPCTEHYDSDDDLECDNCGAVLDPPKQESSVTVSLVGEDGKVYAGATVIAISDNGEFYAVTDENGNAILTLEYDSYTFCVSEGLPENHYSDMITEVVDENFNSLTMNVIDNTPDGSEEKPFFIVDTSDTYSVVGNKALYFSMRSANVTLTVKGDGLKLNVVSDGSEYLSDNGIITIKLSDHIDAENTFSAFTFTLESAEDAEITIEYAYPLGDFANPYTLATDHMTISAVPNGSTVYYKYTATANGILMIKCNSELARATLYNLFGGNIEAAEGVDYAYVTVSEGDEISVSIESSAAEQINAVSFSISLYPATEIDPCPIDKGSITLDGKSGKSYYFTAMSDYTVTNDGEGATFTVNGNAQNATEPFEVEEGDVIVITFTSTTDLSTVITFEETTTEE